MWWWLVYKFIFFALCSYIILNVHVCFHLGETDATSEEDSLQIVTQLICEPDFCYTSDSHQQLWLF